MLLSLKQIGVAASHGEQTQDFACELDLSAVKLWGEHPFSKPVRVSGCVTLRSRVYKISYEADFITDTRCARCLAPVNVGQKRQFEHIILEEPASGNDDEYILAPDLELDLDELVTADLLLELDGITLCKEDCQGLCPKCGKNLNDGACGCDLRERDTRFDVIRKLLEE